MVKIEKDHTPLLFLIITLAPRQGGRGYCFWVCLSVCLFVCLCVCLFVCLSVCPRAYLDEEWSDQVENYRDELVPPWLGPPRFWSKSEENCCHGNGKCENHILAITSVLTKINFSNYFYIFLWRIPDHMVYGRWSYDQNSLLSPNVEKLGVTILRFLRLSRISTLL